MVKDQRLVVGVSDNLVEQVKDGFGIIHHGTREMTANDQSSETAEALRSVARPLHGGGKAEAEAGAVTRAAAPERFSAALLFAAFLDLYALAINVVWLWVVAPCGLA
jgi:hypothetical protein